MVKIWVSDRDAVRVKKIMQSLVDGGSVYWSPEERAAMQRFVKATDHGIATKHK